MIFRRSFPRADRILHEKSNAAGGVGAASAPADLRANTNSCPQMEESLQDLRQECVSMRSFGTSS